MNKRYREQAVKLHKQRLQRRLAEISPEPHYNGRGEAEIVPGYQLAQVLQEWTVKFLRGHNKGGEKDGSQGPVQWLSEQTGIHIRRVSGICNGEYQTVPLSQADALVQAIEQTDLLGKEIQVLPNPNWSLERWVEHMRERGCM